MGDEFNTEIDGFLDDLEGTAKADDIVKDPIVDDNDPVDKDPIVDNDPVIDEDPIIDGDPIVEDPVITALKEQNAQLAQMMEKVLKGAEPEPEPEPEPVDPFTMDSFGKMVETMEWDADEVNSFKAFFGAYMDQHSENVVKQTMKMTPDIVNNAISEQTRLEKTAKTFYDDNPALAHVKGYVKALAQEVSQEGKGQLSIEDILNTTAKRAYSVLGIEKDEGKVDDGKGKSGKKPAFASSKGARKKAPKKTLLQSELDEILDLTF